VGKKSEISDALADIMGTAPKTSPRPSVRSEADRLNALPKDKTVTASFRLLASERTRLDKLFKEKTGDDFASAVKKAVYRYVRDIEEGKA
jgi:hypothetical protein